MWFIGVEEDQETSAPPPKKILDPPLRIFMLILGLKGVWRIVPYVVILIPFDSQLLKM